MSPKRCRLPRGAFCFVAPASCRRFFAQAAPTLPACHRRFTLYPRSLPITVDPSAHRPRSRHTNRNGNLFDLSVDIAANSPWQMFTFC